MSVSKTDIELGNIDEECEPLSMQEASVDMNKIGSKDEKTSLLGKRKKKYDNSLKALRINYLTSYILDAINLFLVFCALTWASAVLIGSYVQNLKQWDYISVPILLLLQYVRIGMLAIYRSVGYRLQKDVRGLLLIIENILLPMIMSGWALLSYNPCNLRRQIRQRLRLIIFNVAPSPIASSADQLTPSGGYGDLQTGLRIFYLLTILSAGIVILELLIKVILYCCYPMLYSSQSLQNYHDKMLEYNNNFNIHSWVDLEFAFKMQSFEYRKQASTAETVCRMYADLVWYLYIHEGGFEAAEIALADTDGYVRQAAANMVGFWAVLETLPEVQGRCIYLPLKSQIGLLSKLADVAAKSYGPTGMAAARSISLLLQGADPVGMATEVKSESGEGLVVILVKRVNQLLRPLWPDAALAKTSRAEASTHINALRNLLLQLRVPAAHVPGMRSASIFNQTQRERIVTEMWQNLLQEQTALNMSSGNVDYIIEKLDCHLTHLLISPANNNIGAAAQDYSNQIKDGLTERQDKSFTKNFIYLVVRNVVAILLGSLVGLILGSLIPVSTHDR